MTRWGIGLAVCLMALGSPGAGQANPERWGYQWPKTDFGTTSVESWDEIRDGGPGRDGIPALDDPSFVPAATVMLDAREPVVTVEIDGAAPRAYPVRFLIWHEIVNDTVGGIPIAVTYCPLCNSFITFDRRTPVGVLRFGVSGKLRHSDMVMFDRQTESWWQQAVGEAIVGALTGTELDVLPTWMESWGAFTSRHPDGLVMAEPAMRRPYGSTPYQGYDRAARPFLYSGDPPPHGVPPLMRVVRVGDRAWPLTRFAQEAEISEAGVRMSWTPGQASALDHGIIAKGRDVGSIRVRDAAGRDVAHDVMFAFAFHAFWPEGIWMLGD